MSETPSPISPVALDKPSSSLRFEVSGRPDFALLTVYLRQGQAMHAEPSAMVSMDPTVKMETSLRGGFLSSVRRGLGGESFFMNTFTAKDGPGEVTFAPGPMGDLLHYRISDGRALLMQRGGYVASSAGVDIDAKFEGLFKKAFFGEGMFLLRASGEGDVFFNTYGAILELEVKDEYIVDNTYVVAFEDTLSYDVTVLTPRDRGLFSSAKSFLFGGERFVSKFSGRGRLFIQTRSVAPFVRWVHPFRPASGRG